MNRIKVDLFDLLARYHAGESVLSISKALGISRPAVVLRLKDSGLKIRGGSESQFLRNARYTPEQRKQFAAAAHDAVRGKKQPIEQRCKIAATNELNGTKHISKHERKMLDWLAERGIVCIPQKAIGPYNVDLAIAESRIAVEIFGGHWHAGGNHAARYSKRMKYLLRRGWCVIVIWTAPKFTIASAEYVVARHQVRRAQEARRGEQHVIRGDAYTTPIAKAKPHNGAVILGVSRGNETRSKDGRFA